MTKYTFSLVLLCLATSAVAQPITHLTGFASGKTAPELDLERRVQQLITPDTVAAIVREISKEVHVAGTPAQARTRDYVVERMKAAGLETTVYPYMVYLPHAKSVSLEMTAPVRKVFSLSEKMLKTEKPDAGYPWVNGFSASGVASGDVVYVNYGLHEDYRDLDSLGISVKGKIVIARYGRSYRGIKAMLAEQHGAIGLLIYADPSNDGYATGDIMPDGPMRPSDGVQRGSIYNGHGDPTTPGYASLDGAPRLRKDTIRTLPRIPVIPVSADIASELLGAMKGGRDLPTNMWQGAFPFRYHIMGGGVRVKLNVVCDTTLKPIWNTVSTVRGSRSPIEWVIVGAHRDAWCYGSEDNASGVASVVAAANAIGRLAQQGVRPQRSILFATWDAEEWGLIGSTEFVEQMEAELQGKVVAYINQDECATGANFGASADPSLRTLVYEATMSVDDPAGGSVYDTWLRKNPPQVTPPGQERRPDIGTLGGGSDFGPFYNHLGAPSIEHGFGGPFGQYHSNHDNDYWTSHFGDTSFAYHAATSKLVAVEALRLANADLLPYDFEGLASFLSQTVYAAKIRAVRTFHDSLSFAALDTAVAHLQIAAANFTRRRDAKLGASATIGERDIMSEKRQMRTNQQLRETFKALLAPEGIDGDTYLHNSLVVSDPANGYADIKLPAIELAMRERNAGKLQREIETLAHRIDLFTANVNDVAP